MSLLKEINREIKTKFPDIYKDNNNIFFKLKSKLYSINFWQILLCYLIVIVFIVFYTKYISLDILKLINVNFEDNIKTFSTIIITLVSMNLFVTNLLLTHLKDERDDIQSIIDERVNFKFITYLGFSIILCILLLYFVSPSILIHDVKSNILIFIFSSFIFYILQLVILYNRVFNFIHKGERLQIIKQELNIEFSRAFYRNYIKSEFKKRYIQFMEEQSFERFSYFMFENLTHISLKNKKPCYLKDINVQGIKDSAKKVTSERYYYELELDNEYLENTEINLLSFSQSTNVNFTKNYIFSRKKLFAEKYNQQHLDKLLKKIDNNTLSNKFSDLKSNLSDLDEVYTKYINIK